MLKGNSTTTKDPTISPMLIDLPNKKFYIYTTLLLPVKPLFLRNLQLYLCPMQSREHLQFFHTPKGIAVEVRFGDQHKQLHDVQLTRSTIGIGKGNKSNNSVYLAWRPWRLLNISSESLVTHVRVYLEAILVMNKFRERENCFSIVYKEQNNSAQVTRTFLNYRIFTIPE